MPDLIEVAAGTALEPLRLPADGQVGAGPRQRPGAARAVLEDQLLAAAVRGQVSVSFSGGRDSSLILGLATAVARREGLPDPLPVTKRHRSAVSREDEEQEAVIRHLGLTDWTRIEVLDELDLLGDTAREFYARAGLHAPPNAYLHLPLARAAGTGTLLTGIGGDEVLGPDPWRLAEVLTGRSRARPRDLALLVWAGLPTSLRRRSWARREAFTLPWLTDRAHQEVRSRLAADAVRTRVRWDAGARLWSRGRARHLAARAIDAVAEVSGVAIETPLASPDFVDAFTGECGIAGPPSREWSMRHLGHDVVPEAVLTRTTKAAFDGLLWGPRARAFVDAWDPDQLDPALKGLVDAAALGQAWRVPSPVYPSLLLLQHAWLGRSDR